MSEIEWPSPFGYTIFCDDIRFELGNKPSFMGVYMGDMFVEQFPLVLPKFCFFVNYMEKPEDVGQPLELHIYFPGDVAEPTIRSEVPKINPAPAQELSKDPVLGDPSTRAGVSFPIVLVNFTVTEPGSLKVRMRRGDDIVKLGALRVSVHPDAATAPSDANPDTPPPS